MSGWPRSRKRLLLAAMLVPWVLVVAGCVAAGGVLAGGDATLFELGFGCFLAGFAIAFVTGLTCIADAAGDRRVEQRAGWIVSLLLGPSVAGPAYWWLHVRPGPGEPHGLQTLAPAWSWSRRAKAASGAGAGFTLLFLVAYGAWIGTIFVDFEAAEDAAVVVFAAFGVWAIVTGAVLTLFFLDALRTGGTHAWLWGVLLLFAWPFAAPLYWLLYVRPTSPRDAAL